MSLPSRNRKKTPVSIAKDYTEYVRNLDVQFRLTCSGTQEYVLHVKSVCS